MTPKKSRDWSEWKEHVTGMHRLDNGFRQQHMGTSLHRLQTHTAISLREMDLEEDQKEPRIWVWVLVFIGMLLVRKCYFEFTKYDRIKSNQEISRQK